MKGTKNTKKISCVPLVNPELSENMGFAHFHKPPPIDVQSAARAAWRARAALQLENLALRHQIGVLQRSVKKRPKLTAADRILWAWLCGVWSEWRSALVIVKPETVIAWHQRQISGARHVAEPSRRNLAADLPPAQPLSDMDLEPGEAARWENSLRSWVDRCLYWLRQPLSID